MMFCLVQGIGERTVGIYVKKVVDGGVAQRVSYFHLKEFRIYNLMQAL